MNKKTMIKKNFRIKIIKTTTLVVLFSLISCCLMVSASTYNFTKKIITKDINFFLSETSNNFQLKTDIMEEIIVKISESKIIYNYLMKVYEKQEIQYSSLNIEKELMSKAELYNYNNTNGTGNCFIDKIYVFDVDGTYYKTMFNNFNRQTRYGFDKMFNNLYNVYKDKKQPMQFFNLKDSVIVSYQLFSDDMDVIGTIMFSLNKNFINSLYQTVKNYDEAFWFLYSDENNVFIGNSDEKITELYLSKIIKHPFNENNTIKINRNKYITNNKKFSMGINGVIAIPENTISKALYKAMAIPLLIVFILTLVLLYFTSKIIFTATEPLKDITQKLQGVLDGEYNSKLPDYDSVEFHNISTVFNNMTNEINYLINDVYKKQLMIKESDLKFLQSQMNPHFMFNVLNTIGLKAKLDKNDDIYQMIYSFSQLAQASIYRKNKEKVQLKEEFKYIEFYLYLQSYRFGENLKYELIYENEKMLECYIPKFTIQVLVENAVVHGIEKSTNKGKVTVNLKDDGENIIISVVDNGMGFEDFEGRIIPPLIFEENNQNHNHVGLNNVQDILHYYYGEEYGIAIDTNKNGTEVTVVIPIDKSELK